MAPDSIPLNQVHRILVIKLRHHGDVLLSSPVFSVLRESCPTARIDALVYADTSDMLSLHPAINHLYQIDRGWKKLGLNQQASAEFRLFKELRGAKYDLIVHLTEHWRGAWLARLLRPRWSVAPKQDSAGKLWATSFTHLYALPRGTLRHTVEINLDALRRIGIRPAEANKKLILIPGQEATRKISDLIQKHGLSTGEFIHIHPTSRWLFKCWPEYKFSELIDRLSLSGHSVVLTCAPAEKEMAMLKEIQGKLSQPVLSLAGQLSLKELAALTASSKLFIGVDSAPMHIAAASNVPTVAIFGPSKEKEWGPWKVNARILTDDSYTCRPCNIDGCGGGKISECLVSLSVDKVYAASMELLD